MSAHKYAASFDPSINVPDRNGVRGAIVVAESTADAKALLQALHADEVTGGWANATFTEMAAAADMAGWNLRVQVLKVSDGSVTADVTVTGAAAATVDTIAALMVIALNATTPIANAAYNSGTNVLTVAGTADNLGDHRVYAFMAPPGSSVSVPGFVGAITDEGSAGAALTVALAADAYTVPKVTAKFANASRA